MKVIRHIAGEMVDGVQYCVVCGNVIVDYRRAYHPPGSPPPKGFAEGEVFKKGNITAVVPFAEEEFEDCKP